jgi:uncharacterized coiled-coil protein SlyX
MQSDFVTLTEAARILNQRRGTIEQRIRRGTIKAEKQGGIWYVEVPTSPYAASETVGVQIPSEIAGTPTQAIVGVQEAEEGIWQAIAEQTDLIERLTATISEQERTIKHLNAALNDTLSRLQELESLRQCDRQEIERIGHLAGAYRAVETREERQKTVVYEASRAGVMGNLSGLFGKGRRVVG